MGAIHAGCDARRVLLRLARTSSGIALAIGIFSSIVELTFHQRRARYRSDANFSLIAPLADKEKVAGFLTDAT